MKDFTKKMMDEYQYFLEKAHSAETSEECVGYLNCAAKCREMINKEKNVYKDIVGPILIALTPALIVEIVHNRNLTKLAIMAFNFEKDGTVISSVGKGIMSIFKKL